MCHFSFFNLIFYLFTFPILAPFLDSPLQTFYPTPLSLLVYAARLVTVSEKSQESRSVETAVLPNGLPTSSVSSRFSTIQQQGSPDSFHCLGLPVPILSDCPQGFCPVPLTKYLIIFFSSFLCHHSHLGNSLSPPSYNCFLPHKWD